MGASFSNSDLDWANKANGVSTQPANYGYKMGGGRAEFAFSATNATTAAHGTGLIVPKGATVTRAVYKVLTTFTSPTTDDATLAIHLVSANDIVSAVSIVTATTWDAGIPVLAIPVTATASTWLHTTVDSELTVTVGVEAITAGKMVIFLEWMYWGDLSLT